MNTSTSQTSVHQQLRAIDFSNHLITKETYNLSGNGNDHLHMRLHARHLHAGRRRAGGLIAMEIRQSFSKQMEFSFLCF